MSLLRAVVPALLIASWAWTAEPAPVAPPEPPAATAPAAADALMKLLDTAITHGFPDGAGATIHRGTLSVVESETDGRQRQQRFHRTQVKSSGGQRTTTYEGLHLKLADGRWVAGFSTVITPSATVTVDPSACTVIPAEGLRAAFPAQHEMGDKQLAEMEKRVPVSQLAGMKAAMRWQGLFEASQFQGGIMLPALLIRAGVPDAVDLLWTRNFMGMYLDRMNSVKPLIVRPEDQAQDQQRQMRRMQEMSREMMAGKAPTIPDVPMEGHLRAGLVEWYMAELVSDQPVVATQTAASALTTLVAGEQDAPRAAQIALLIERAALPATVAAEAPLADRLALWRPFVLPHGMDAATFATIPEEHRKNMDLPESTGPAITATDLPQLFALLTDGRASHWLEGESQFHPFGKTPVVRTRGDNALRAIANLLGLDPRYLIGRNVFAPWNAEERAATAMALQAWHQVHGNEPVGGQLVSVITTLPAGSAAGLIRGRPEAERAPLIAAVVASWDKAQPTGEAAVGFPALLALVGEAAKATVLAWPVEGVARLALAIYHDQHGDAAVLDALIPELFGDSAEFIDQRDRQSMLAALAMRPSAERLAKLRILLDDHASPAGQAVLQATLQYNWNAWEQDTRALLDAGRKDRGEQQVNDQALGMALIAGVLADRAAIPAGLIKVQQWGMQIGTAMLPNRHMGDGKAEPLKLPADLRWCDLAAYSVINNSWHFRVGDDRPDELEFDLSAPIAERDAQLAALRIAIDPAISAACAAAGLPVPAGGAAPAAGDKTLF
jgi:hypothetical protein